MTDWFTTGAHEASRTAANREQATVVDFIFRRKDMKAILPVQQAQRQTWVYNKNGGGRYASTAI
jgi:hypothetical protein